MTNHDNGSAQASSEGLSAEFDAPGTGPFYVYDAPTIERAAEHGCLDEDVETGDPIACVGCVFPPGE